MEVNVWGQDGADWCAGAHRVRPWREGRENAPDYAIAVAPSGYPLAAVRKFSYCLCMSSFSTSAPSARNLRSAFALIPGGLLLLRPART